MPYEPTCLPKRNELAPILPLLICQPELLGQLQNFGIPTQDLEAACYQLYDQQGIDALLEIHPLRESFFQMELSQERFQAFASTSKPKAEKKKKEQDQND